MAKVISTPYLEVYQGDALEMLREVVSDSVDCCVTSPPYWGLRDYGHAAQIGLESSPHEYIAKLVAVFDEVRRVLKPSGTCWIVIGDSYASGSKGSGGDGGNLGQRFPPLAQTSNAGSRFAAISVKLESSIKPKDLCGIPWRLAFALQDRGWWLRQDIIWAKPNPMPESVTDRCTRSHEYVFLLTKCARYFYNAGAIAETAISGADLGMLRGSKLTADTFSNRQSIRHRQLAGIDSRTANPTMQRNQRDVWSIQTEPYALAHFATFPTKLVERCILAGSPHDGVVLDPFAGCGTTGEVAVKLGRRAVLVELNPEYVEMILHNLGLFAGV